MFNKTFSYAHYKNVDPVAIMQKKIPKISRFLDSKFLKNLEFD